MRLVPLPLIAAILGFSFAVEAAPKKSTDPKPNLVSGTEVSGHGEDRSARPVMVDTTKATTESKSTVTVIITDGHGEDASSTTIYVPPSAVTPIPIEHDNP